MAIPVHVWEQYRVKPGARVRLREEDADATELCDDKKDARKQLHAYTREIDALAKELALEGKRSLLLVLQGMDASGKDGTVKHVFTGVNPQYCRVVSFKAPDREESEHDYLWRAVRAMPARGELGVWNRSHYEDVVARRARGDISEQVARMRLRQIAETEREWVENGTSVVKVFLHISRDEQTQRFKRRLENPAKHWKVQESDFEDRKIWPKFMRVYEETFARTATDFASWYLVPANHKWYRDVAVAGIVLHALKRMKPKAPRVELDPYKFEL